jgi:hypothetical protein
MSDNDMGKLAPRVEKVPVGIREIEEIEIWPLSMADQLEIGKLFDEAISAIVAQSFDELTTVMCIRKLIEENLSTVLMMITDYDTEPKVKKLMKKISNDQFVDICEKVYSMNFERISKNVSSLFGKIGLSALGRLLPTSLNDTQNMESSISQDSPINAEG